MEQKTKFSGKNIRIDKLVEETKRMNPFYECSEILKKKRTRPEINSQTEVNANSPPLFLNSQY